MMRTWQEGSLSAQSVLLLRLVQWVSSAQLPEGCFLEYAEPERLTASDERLNFLRAKRKEGRINWAGER